jgi:hypothetical protein
MEKTAVEFIFDAVYRDITFSELLGIIAQAKIMEKQQDKNKYSEEDLREAFKGGGKMSWTDIDQETQEPYYYDFKEWFEQFKKK